MHFIVEKYAFHRGRNAMNGRKQQGEFTVTTKGTFNQLQYTGVHQTEESGEKNEAAYTSSSLEEMHQGHTPDKSPSGEGSIAYELLLLQQRLAAYEQLHIEEMAELRQEVERLRRAFLQETNPHLRALSPKRNLYGSEGE
jgi:hypothetical protein